MNVVEYKALYVILYHKGIGSSCFKVPIKVRNKMYMFFTNQASYRLPE